jgi:hypothetical protein
MPTVLFKPTGHDTLVNIKCSASGRCEFSYYECSYRSRKACADGSADFCLILEGGQIIAKWERLPNGEAKQTAGKEIL